LSSLPKLTQLEVLPLDIGMNVRRLAVRVADAKKHTRRDLVAHFHEGRRRAGVLSAVIASNV